MDTVDEIKRKLDLPEYIGRSVVLQRSGRYFKGLCPFHQEKTPSFYVFPDRGTWRCFGTCGEGGDLFSFVQKRENLDFRGALKELAAEAGVQLSAEDSKRRGRTEKLSAIVSAAVDFYQQQLKAPGGAAALEYLTETRGITGEAIAAFRIGWAPDDWRELRDHLVNRGYDEGDIVAAGLLVAADGGGAPYDRFRGRVIIPIADEHGLYVAMGGRGIHGEEPKYLNSPQTELFDKGRTLFGLTLAATAIRETGTAVVVEGYMDVIGPWQAGFRNVVATMGTSLTEHHVTLLKRHARRVVLAMDPDAAGFAAAERAGGLFLGLDSPENMARAARSADRLVSDFDVELQVAPLAPGKDPDEVARDNPAGWAAAIDGAVPYPEFLLKRLMGNERPASSVEARKLVLGRLLPVLVAVQSPVDRARYEERVARHLGVPEQAVHDWIAEVARPRRASRDRGNRGGPAAPEQILLALLIRHPELRHEVRHFPPDLFTDALDREAFLRWVNGPADMVEASADAVSAHLQRLENLRLPPLTEDEARRAVEAKVKDILRERRILHQAAVTDEISAAERTLGANRVAEVSVEAFRGERPQADAQDLAETAIEELELGLSIHRHEEPWASQRA